MNEGHKPPPIGSYGVFCEPIGHMGNPQWIYIKETSYEEAIKKADYMNRSNYAWFYYAKPILFHKEDSK